MFDDDDFSDLSKQQEKGGDFRQNLAKSAWKLTMRLKLIYDLHELIKEQQGKRIFTDNTNSRRRNQLLQQHQQEQQQQKQQSLRQRYYESQLKSRKTWNLDQNSFPQNYQPSSSSSGTNYESSSEPRLRLLVEILHRIRNENHPSSSESGNSILPPGNGGRPSSNPGAAPQAYYNTKRNQEQNYKQGYYDGYNRQSRKNYNRGYR